MACLETSSGCCSCRAGSLAGELWEAGGLPGAAVTGECGGTGWEEAVEVGIAGVSPSILSTGLALLISPVGKQ